MSGVLGFSLAKRRQVDSRGNWHVHVVVLFQMDGRNGNRQRGGELCAANSIASNFVQSTNLHSQIQLQMRLRSWPW